ncbi:MAG: response regulator [Thermodesulfobacteriota bacterium]|nr:response regulator [Thermodesulfobacteriota bacterium]
MNESRQKQTSILIVDDEQSIRELIEKTVGRNNYTCFQASNGKDALEILDREHVDVVITDITMPVMDGIALTRKIRASYDQDVLMMTGYIQDVTYENAIAKGANDFIQKPFDLKEFTIRLTRVVRERRLREDLKKALDQSKKILEGMINSLSLTVEARDPYTAGHQKRVAGLACAMAEYMGLSREQAEGIHMAGTVHDLGKISIPAELLSKPTRLTETEFNLIKCHPQVGFDILKDISFPFPLARIVYQHHERIDGSGYPNGLSEDEILPEAKIMAVADVVEAMSSHRPYRPALGLDIAFEEISKNKGRLYDKDAVTACLALFQEKGFSFN